jgi:hypothetical protein
VKVGQQHNTCVSIASEVQILTNNIMIEFRGELSERKAVTHPLQNILKYVFYPRQTESYKVSKIMIKFQQIHTFLIVMDFRVP